MKTTALTIWLLARPWQPLICYIGMYEFIESYTENDYLLMLGMRQNNPLLIDYERNNRLSKYVTDYFRNGIFTFTY